ncbi:hypothetical protein [Terribacillus saccharophilus]|uniref:hypothetical protein n=1 Tax=Terribacillus saccharophilus TaxID=361277 RepID=UPI002989D360|nr:hypothetical protein [Terribacillus saccharophilus]MCM3227543.1 hypothetical protein [Terribacillus saccharophilus]
MQKYGIRLFNSDTDAHLIFHATPFSTEYTWQWYITDDKSKKGEAIKEAIYESFTTTTEIIDKFKENGKYLYCVYIDNETQEEFTSEFIQLFTDFNKIIENNSAFYDVASYDSKGWIRESGEENING